MHTLRANPTSGVRHTGRQDNTYLWMAGCAARVVAGSISQAHHGGVAVVGRGSAWTGLGSWWSSVSFHRRGSPRPIYPVRCLRDPFAHVRPLEISRKRNGGRVARVGEHKIHVMADLGGEKGKFSREVGMAQPVHMYAAAVPRAGLGLGTARAEDR